MITLITLHTNQKIQSKINQLTPEIIQEKNLYYCHVTDEVEIKAFIGLMYLRGLLGMNHHKRTYLFHSELGPPLFGATMSSKRFGFLNSNICFDDIQTRNVRWEQDRFAAIRDGHTCT
jgi:hypothetical protein